MNLFSQKNIIGDNPMDTEKNPYIPVTNADGQQAFIAYWLIGGATSNNAYRKIGWGIPNPGGWQRFFNEKIQPQLDIGIRRFHLHNPFGLDERPPMPIDQYIKVLESDELRHMTDDFYETWADFLYANRDVEVIAYNGKFDGDPILNNLIVENDIGGWMSRIHLCYTPYLDCNMSIGYDAIAKVGSESREFQLLQLHRNLLESAGRKAYIEASPKTGQYHLYDYDLFIIDKTWRLRNTLPAWRESHKLMSGEIIRLVSRPSSAKGQEYEWGRAACQMILNDGHTATFSQFWQLSTQEQKQFLKDLQII